METLVYQRLNNILFVFTTMSAFNNVNIICICDLYSRSKQHPSESEGESESENVFPPNKRGKRGGKDLKLRNRM